MKLITKLLLIPLLFGLTEGLSQRLNPVDDSYTEYFGSGEFTLKGSVDNAPEGYQIEFAVTDYLTNHGMTLEVAADGTFEGNFPVTDVQEVYLYLGDAVTVFAYSGAVLGMEFDYNDLPGSIKVGSPDPVYDRDLQLAMEIYRQTRQDFININRLGDQEKTEFEKIEHANAYIDKVNSIVAEFVAREGETRNATLSPMKAYYHSAVCFSNNARIIGGTRRLFYGNGEPHQTIPASGL